MVKSYIAAVTMLIAPCALRAQFVPGPDDTYVEQGTLSPSFTTGPNCPYGDCELGWSYFAYVDDSGNVNWIFSDYSTPVNWTGLNYTASVPALPVWDVYTTATATFAFEPPPYPNYSASFSDASISDGCTDTSATISPSKTEVTATFQIPATPCNPVFALQADGSSSIIPDWTLPSAPGYYSDTEFFPPPEIDYTIMLNYADPPPVPEPSYFAAAGFGVIVLVWFGRRKRTVFGERS